jgi:hypothetical protein
MIHHVLITRFNLKIHEWDRDKNDNVVNNSRWLTNRIRLFLTYCLPSVLQQSKKNFSWHLFFQEGSKDQVKAVLEALAPHPFISSHFLGGYEQFQQRLPQIIASSCRVPVSHLITSRLDNDDALHRHYIRDLQKTFRPEMDKVVLDFPKGLCVDLSQSPRLVRLQFPQNQFISLVERYRDNHTPVTVFTSKHNQWGPPYTVVSLPQPDRWLQVVHDTNVLNVCHGSPEYPSCLSGFPNLRVSFSKSYWATVFLAKVRNSIATLPGWYRIKKLFT